jgi:hypothetical protein
MKQAKRSEDLTSITSVSETKRAKLLQGLDLARSQGIEIGALCRPFVRKDEGSVIYVDHADTETLRHKYQQADDVDINSIVEVDAVWGESSLYEAVQGRLFDWVIASHVVEHVPDLISWLCELASVLKVTGEVRLIIPDKRYTFDYLRQTTRLSDVMLSYMKQARVPQAHSILDFALNAVKIEQMTARGSPLHRDNLELHYTWQEAMSLAMDAEANYNYHDVHCWTFTPASFAELMEQICSFGLVDFACENFINTLHNQNEFFVTLRRSNNKIHINNSWRKMFKVASDSSSALPEWDSYRKAGLSDVLDPLSRFSFSRKFDEKEYLNANPDVLASNMNPLLHYLLYGAIEGRRLSVE